jgi:hypothetical protein
MSNLTLLITAEDVRTITPVRGSVDNDYINPAIQRAQDLRLAYIIGSALLRKLQDVVNGGEDQDGRYINLINAFIKPYLAWVTAYNLIPDIAFQIGQAGVFTAVTNQGSSVFEGQMALVKQNILSASDGYKKLLMMHLCDKSTLYPEYNEFTQGEQQRSDSGKAFHGIQFY